MSVVLRPYQKKIKQDIYDSWASGHRNVMAVLPTGGGKTQVFSDIAYDGVTQGLNQALIVHRNELVSQISVTLASRGINHKIIGSDKAISRSVRRQREKLGRSFYNPSSSTAVVGVDTMIARASSLKSWGEQVGRWVQDEAHHGIGSWVVDDYGNPVYTSDRQYQYRTKPNKWGKAVVMLPNAQGLGVTATPQRADGQGLGRHADGFYDSMVMGPSMRWLIDSGYLSDYEIVCPLSDMQVRDEDRGKNGDWSSQYLKKSAKKSHIVGDVVENYIKYALGRKAICFATDVETAGDIAADFNSVGIRAAALSSKTDDTVRDKYLDEFEAGILHVLVNVDLFDEGFDVPTCEVCIMARPTASLGKYKQMAGRVLRYVEGKVALIIDHVSNVTRHGLPDKEIMWSLDRREKRTSSVDPEDLPMTICLNKSCIKPYPRFKTCCPHCGTMKPLPEPRERSVEMVEGDLILLDKEALRKMRVATIIENPADVASRVAKAAGYGAGKVAADRQIEKVEEHRKLRDAMAQWVAIQRLKGHDDREIEKKFYHTVGFDVLSALDASKTRVEMLKIRETIESWYA